MAIGVGQTEHPEAGAPECVEDAGHPNGVDPRDVLASGDDGAPSFQVLDVAELSKRQQNLARQIVLNMNGKGPYGVSAGKVEGHGILRKVLPMLWE